MYNNKILNFQESTTNLKACTKKGWKLIECTTYIYIYIYIYWKKIWLKSTKISAMKKSYAYYLSRWDAAIFSLSTFFPSFPSLFPNWHNDFCDNNQRKGMSPILPELYVIISQPCSYQKREKNNLSIFAPLSHDQAVLTIKLLWLLSSLTVLGNAYVFGISYLN